MWFEERLICLQKYLTSLQTNYKIVSHDLSSLIYREAEEVWHTSLLVILSYHVNSMAGIRTVLE